MSVFEYHGGPITHHYLMKKSKSELASMYMDLLRIHAQQLRRSVAKEVSPKRGSDSPPKNDGTRDEVDAADARS